ncbi:MAG: glycosyltransferase [Planctomycetota bacterium]
MRITWLLESADQLWGGVKSVLEDANWLHRRGHQVTVLSRTGPPSWMQVECAFQRVRDFHAEHMPDADVLVATFWTTVPWAASAGEAKGVPVHYCQGYEGDMREHAQLKDRIEAVYRLPGVRHIAISPNIARLLRERFAVTAIEIPYAIDHETHRPGPERAPGKPLRVGLVGPYQVSWKDLATGYAACRLAHAAGQDLVLVRAANTARDPAERNLPFPVEWHGNVAPTAMGDFYRSLDLFLGTSSGAQEGFFLPAVEAMACGVPIVLTDIPCFKSHAQLVGDDNYALFVPPADPAAMAEAIVVAGRMPEVRATMRRQGLAVAAHYDRERHGEQLEAALLRIHAEANPGRTPLRLVTTTRTGDDAVAHDFATRLQHEADRRTASGDIPAAARFLAAAAALQPETPELQRAVAEAHHRAGEHTAALALLDREIAGGADDERIHLARGSVLHALGRYHDAAQAFRAAIAVGARTADAFNRLGIVLFQAEDLRGARQSFERALVLQPDHADARANLAALPAA